MAAAEEAHKSAGRKSIADFYNGSSVTITRPTAKHGTSATHTLALAEEQHKRNKGKAPPVPPPSASVNGARGDAVAVTRPSRGNGQSEKQRLAKAEETHKVAGRASVGAFYDGTASKGEGGNATHVVVTRPTRGHGKSAKANLALAEHTHKQAKRNASASFYGKGGGGGSGGSVGGGGIGDTVAVTRPLKGHRTSARQKLAMAEEQHKTTLRNGSLPASNNGGKEDDFCVAGEAMQVWTALENTSRNTGGAAGSEVGGAVGAVEKLCQGSLGIARANMPQIRNASDFVAWLHSKKWGGDPQMENVTVATHSVGPTQKDISLSKAKSIGQAMQLPSWSKGRAGRIIISNDGHLLDGHHRWASLVLRGVARVDVLRIDLSIRQLLAAAAAYLKERPTDQKWGGGVNRNTNSTR